MLLFKRIKYNKYIRGYESAITGIIEYSTNLITGLGNPSDFLLAPANVEMSIIATCAMLLSCINRYTDNPLSKPSTLIELKNAAEVIHNFDKIFLHKKEYMKGYNQLKQMDHDIEETDKLFSEHEAETVYQYATEVEAATRKQMNKIAAIHMDLLRTLIHVIMTISDEYTMCKTGGDIIKDRFAPCKPGKINITFTPANNNKKGE